MLNPRKTLGFSWEQILSSRILWNPDAIFKGKTWSTKAGEAPVTPSILLCYLPTFPVFQGLRFPASRWKFHLEHGDQAQASLGFDIPADCFSRPPDPAPREPRVQRSNKSSGRFISSQNSSIFSHPPHSHRDSN